MKRTLERSINDNEIQINPKTTSVASARIKLRQERSRAPSRKKSAVLYKNHLVEIPCIRKYSDLVKDQIETNCLLKILYLREEEISLFIHRFENTKRRDFIGEIIFNY